MRQFPKDPILFNKAPSCISGPYDPVRLPKNSTKTDWEVELALVIGKPAHYVDEADALDYVAGYFVCNDVSEREFQLERSGQWVKGKMVPDVRADRTVARDRRRDTPTCRSCASGWSSMASASRTPRPAT